MVGERRDRAAVRHRDHADLDAAVIENRGRRLGLAGRLGRTTMLVARTS